MNTIIKNYPESTETWSLVSEIRTDKHGNEVKLYRVNYINSVDKPDYICFQKLESALDFVTLNLSDGYSIF